MIWEALSHEKFIQIIASKQAGLGKSKIIKELSKYRGCSDMRSLSISGNISREYLVKVMKEIKIFPGIDSLHINILDVHTSYAELMNDVLFEILCLSMLGSSASLTSSLVHINVKHIFVELGNTIGSDLYHVLPLLKHSPCNSRIQLEPILFLRQLLT